MKYKRNIAKDTSKKLEDQTLFSFLLTIILSNVLSVAAHLEDAGTEVCGLAAAGPVVLLPRLLGRQAAQSLHGVGGAEQYKG